jgi:hypothetical protein
MIQGNMQRRRLMMPPHPVLAQLAWEVLTTPPTDEEIHLLTEVVEEAQEQNLEPAEIETRLRGTRIWHWLKVIAKNDVRIATELMLGVVRPGELATGVTFAIVGGTGKFKKAQGTATVKTPEITCRVS